MKRIIIACFVFVALAFASVAYAGPADKPPTKESLLAAWEQVQKQDPNTVKLEKAGDKNIYDFETNFFPYKGKLNILNLVIDEGAGYYYDEDDETAPGTYSGVVELELVGADKDFKEKFEYSYSRWARNNRLIYDEKTSKWYTRGEWVAYRKELRAASTNGGACNSTVLGGKDQLKGLLDVIGAWIPMIVLIGVWVYFVRFAKGRQSKLQDKYTKLAEDNHALLSEILEVLKRKS